MGRYPPFNGLLVSRKRSAGRSAWPTSPASCRPVASYLALPSLRGRETDSWTPAHHARPIRERAGSGHGLSRAGGLDETEAEVVVAVVWRVPVARRRTQGRRLVVPGTAADHPADASGPFPCPTSSPMAAARSSAVGAARPGRPRKPARRPCGPPRAQREKEQRTKGYGSWTRRKPRSLSRSSGESLSRAAERRADAWSFQEPPRTTRKRGLQSRPSCQTLPSAGAPR